MGSRWECGRKEGGGGGALEDGGEGDGVEVVGRGKQVVGVQRARRQC